MEVYGKYFYGNEVSEYGLKYGYVDYRTFSKAFDAVLANNIINFGYWEPVSNTEYYVDAAGTEYNEEERNEKIEELEARRAELEELENMSEKEAAELEEVIENIEALEVPEYKDNEVYQWYIIDSNGAEICEEAGEIVYYNEELDLYLWGVTHWGTSWDYVLTNIRCNTGLKEMEV